MEFKTVGRDRLARELLKLGPITASDLADSLGISAVAVRKHLDDMSEKSLVESHEIAPFGPTKTKGRGRQEAVTYLATTFGDNAVKAFALSRANEMLAKYSQTLNKAKNVEEKVEILSNFLTKDGFAATAEKGSGPTHTIQLCQHNCPIAHVAEQHPEFCEAELDAFSELLGVNVTRLSTIANGGNICTSLVSTLPKTAVSSASQHKEKK
jgi:predicted ArsR family transcriptional regulator